MKSSHTSISPLRRALVAATVVLATGSVAAFAQNASSAQDSTMQGSSTTSTANDQANMNMNATTNTSSTSNDRMANNESSNASSEQKLSHSDRRFVEKAAEGGQSEVALGQLAQEKASNPDVKSFAQSLVQDHQNANSQLMQIAQQKDVKLKEDKSKEDHEYKRLAKASGDEFDREFIKNQVKDHKKDIKMFEKAAKDSKDEDVRNFATQVLPKLREHLAMAQRLEQSIAPTGRTGSHSWRSDAGSTTETSSGNATVNTNATGTTGATSSTDVNAGTAPSSSTSTSTTR